MARLLVQELASIILRLKAKGVTMRLVEQNVRVALAIADQVVVLGKGALVFAGPRAAFHQREEELKGRYLSV